MKNIAIALYLKQVQQHRIPITILFLSSLEMRGLASVVAIAAAQAAAPHGYACIDPPINGLPFCDNKNTIASRVADLLSRMERADKMNLLASKPGTDMCGAQDQGVTSLGMPPVINLMEANSGVSAACYVDENQIPYCPTIFPAPLSLAASFNRTLFTQKGEVVGREARAFNNLNATRIYGVNVDLLGFGPE